MNMVATSKFKKAQAALLKLRPYNDKLKHLITNTLDRSNLLNHPLLREGHGSKELLIVVGADRGLCGSFNNTIIKYVNDLDLSNSDIVAVGTKIVRALLKNPKARVIEEHRSFFEDLTIEKTAEFTAQIRDHFLSSNYHSVRVIYIYFKNALAQDISTLDILPLSGITADDNFRANTSDFIYEPDKAIFINELFTRYLTGTFFRIFNESYTSEQGSRMTAMDSATQNANQMGAELNTLYNRARQAAITTELTEITAGVEAQGKK